jgi:hypothetical protein
MKVIMVINMVGVGPAGTNVRMALFRCSSEMPLVDSTVPTRIVLGRNTLLPLRDEVADRGA